MKMSTCFHLKCNSSWQGNSRDREHQGFLQPAGERWTIISFLKCRSVIKWHRLAHFNQKKWAGELVDFMLGVLWRLLTHISPNSCLWQRFPLWVRNYISPQVTRSFSDSENHTRVLGHLSFCSVDIFKSLGTSLLTFSPLPLFPVLQLTLSQRLSLTHQGSCWPPGIKEAEWLSSRGSRR